MATVEIEAWKVRAYAANVHHIAQGMQNKLRGTTREENQAGLSIAFRRIAAMRGRVPTVRLEPIVHATADHSQRLVFPIPWSFDAAVDSFDKAQQIHDPESEYAKSGGADYNHVVDQRIIDAALGDAAHRGSEESAISLVSFDATNQLVPEGGTGLLLHKITQARAILGHNTNNEWNLYGPFYFVYDPLDIRFLFAETKVTSTDFANVKALMTGDMVNGFLGFNWIASNQLPTGALNGEGDANTRHCVAFAKAGMGFGSNMGARKERMGERNDITGHPMQVSIYDEFGAVRIDERLVVQVAVDSAATPS